MNNRPFRSHRYEVGQCGAVMGRQVGQKQKISDSLQSLVFTYFFKEVGQKGQYIFFRFKKTINI